MADKEGLQHAGDYDLDGALIVGSSGEKINVHGQVKELNIYQSIDCPFMSGNMLIADSQGVAEILPLMGQERLLFSLKTPGHSNTVNFNKYHAIIYNVEKRFQTSDREQTIFLNWTTLEHYKNIRTKISKSFNGTISSIVQKILKNKNYLGTKKPVNIDVTRNLRKYVIPNLNPFQAINLLKTEAISAEEQSPHFLFFENPNGFHFRSLDSLIGQKGSLSVQHKQTYRFQPPEAPQNPEKTLGTILEWELSDNFNNFLGVKLGMHSSTLYYHDIFNKNVQRFVYSYSKSFKKRNSLSQESKKSGSLVSGAKIDDKTITEYPNSKIFVHPTASDKLHSLGTDNNAEEWLQESQSRELEREYFTLKITTHGDTDIMCGDLINVVIPSNKPLDKTGGKEAMDPTLSGRYLITSLHHLVVPSESNHAMVMTIMKDSVESATSVMNIQYPQEPQGSADVGLNKRKLTMKTKNPHLG